MALNVEILILHFAPLMSPPDLQSAKNTLLENYSSNVFVKVTIKFDRFFYNVSSDFCFIKLQ